MTHGTEALDVRPGQLWRWTFIDGCGHYVVMTLFRDEAFVGDDRQKNVWYAVVTVCHVTEERYMPRPDRPFAMCSGLYGGTWTLEQDVSR